MHPHTHTLSPTPSHPTLTPSHPHPLTLTPSHPHPHTHNHSTQLTQQCKEVTQEQLALSNTRLRVEALTSFIKEMCGIVDDQYCLSVCLSVCISVRLFIVAGYRKHTHIQQATIPIFSREMNVRSSQGFSHNANIPILASNASLMKRPSCVLWLV